MVNMLADQLYKFPIRHDSLQVSTFGLHMNGSFEMGDGLNKDCCCASVIKIAIVD